MEFDGQVNDVCNRTLDQGPPFLHLWRNTLTMWVRKGSRMVNVACPLTIGVNADTHRQTLGIDITTKGGSGWMAFLRRLITQSL